MDKTKKKKEKFNQLIKKHYKDKGILLRDQMLEREILRNISSDSKVLDAGCGYNAAVLSKYCSLVSEAVGVDLVDKFEVNPKIKTYTANLEKLPFQDDCFDLIISRSTCEHFKNPIEVFKELRRVLKRGGAIIMTTPNKYDYSSIISSLLPTSLKTIFLKNVFGENAYENFPTYYRCNTKRQINKIAQKSGLRLEKFLAIRHYPYYLMFSVVLFRVGILYDRLISALGLDCLQSSFLFVLVKKRDK